MRTLLTCACVWPKVAQNLLTLLSVRSIASFACKRLAGLPRVCWPSVRPLVNFLYTYKGFASQRREIFISISEVIPKTSFEDFPTLRRFPGPSLPMCFGKDKSTNPNPSELFNSFVTMTTHWALDLPGIKGFSCHLWRPVLIFANGASYMYA